MTLVGDSTDAPIPGPVVAWLDERGFGPVVDDVPLSGGTISRPHRLVTTSGRTAVLKQGTLPARLYRCEAEALRALAGGGGPRVPRVFAAGDDFVLMEDMGTLEPGEGFWERFGRELARMHRENRSDRFGYAYDNYLGSLPQHNPWMEDGHRFFGEHRLLRFLEEPLVDETFTAEDRRALEALVIWLPDLIPSQPASLLHGDLWWANMVVGPDGEPAMVDPAVYYGWPEAELSMTEGCGRVPDAFFGAYNEVNPMQPGWRERFRILHLREHLSVIAHLGNGWNTIEKVRAVLGAF